MVIFCSCSLKMERVGRRNEEAAGDSRLYMFRSKIATSIGSVIRTGVCSTERQHRPRSKARRHCLIRRSGTSSTLSWPAGKVRRFRRSSYALSLGEASVLLIAKTVAAGVGDDSVAAAIAACGLAEQNVLMR